MNWEFHNCTPDWAVIAVMAQFAFGWVTIASMSFLLPIILLYVVLWIVSHVAAWVIMRTSRS